MQREDVGIANWEVHARKLARGLAGSELDAVRALYHAVWRAVVPDWWDRYEFSIGDVLAGAAHLGMEPVELGRVFELCTRPASARRMVECVSWLVDYVRHEERQGGDARRLDLEGVVLALRSWLVRDATLAMLLKSQHRFPEPESESTWYAARASTRDLVALRRAGRYPT